MVGQFITKLGIILFIALKIFIFAAFMKNCSFDINFKFICSFDISNLFTCVPFRKTIDISFNSLYQLPPSPLVIEFIEFAMVSVEFSFNSTMYKQTNGIVIISPLGLVLANIFGFYEFVTKVLLDNGNY